MGPGLMKEMVGLETHDYQLSGKNNTDIYLFRKKEHYHSLITCLLQEIFTGQSLHSIIQ